MVKTSEGHVVVDVAMSPFKSRIMRAALAEAAGDAPIHTIIYTHSHIDHVGGASGWAGNGTRIWATDKLTGDSGTLASMSCMPFLWMTHAYEFIHLDPI